MHHYVFIPVDKRSMTTSLFRREFKQGREFEELVEDKGTFYSPPNFDDYPEIQSTVHPYCMIWKAIYEIGNKVTPNEIQNINHRRLYLMASTIVLNWKSSMSPEALNSLSERKPRPPPDSDDPDSDHSSSTPPSNLSEDDSGGGGGGDDNIGGDGESDGDGDGNSGSDGGVFDSCVNGARKVGHQRLSHGSSLISYSNYQPALTFSSSPPKSAPSEEPNQDDESDVVEGRPDDLAPYAPWNVGNWQSKGAQALDDSLQVNHSSAVGVESSSFYHLEKPAQLPPGPWENWRPDFMKDMNEAKYRELAERFGMI